jgi:hypothetical protein
MRKIIAGMFITVDGVVEAPEKWNPPYYDDEMSQAVMPQLTEAGTHLVASRSPPPITTCTGRDQLWALPGRRWYRRTRHAAASPRACPSTADDKRKGDYPLLSTFNL